jgi:molybdopterin/thiamine biosynthesis adenylyltransferase
MIPGHGNTGLSHPALDGTINVGDTGLFTGSCQNAAAGNVVQGVQNRVAACDKGADIFFGHESLHCFRGDIGVDPGDVFETTNLNRQLFSEIPVLGQNKAKVAADRIARINPEITVDVVQDFLTEENAAALLQDCDIAVDALDNIPGRRILAAACEKSGIPLVYGAISGWVAQSALSMPGDKLVEKLYPEDTVVRDKSVLSFTPALCASMQASLCVKLLAGRPVETGTVYYFDLLNQEFETIPLV